MIKKFMYMFNVTALTRLWSHSPKSICTFSYFSFYFPGICKYLFSPKQQMRHSRHLTIRCGRHFVWYYGEQMDEWEALNPCLWHTSLVIMSAMKYSPSSGSIKRLLVLFTNIFYLSIALMWSYKVIRDIFLILYTHCSKKVTLQSVNLLSDYLETYVP